MLKLKKMSATGIILTVSLKLFRAIERVRNYVNAKVLAAISRKKIISFQMEPPAKIKLLHCKTISHWKTETFIVFLEIRDIVIEVV